MARVTGVIPPNTPLHLLSPEDRADALQYVIPVVHEYIAHVEHWRDVFAKQAADWKSAATALQFELDSVSAGIEEDTENH